jgi:hypothetical protein
MVEKLGLHPDFLFVNGNAPDYQSAPSAACVCSSRRAAHERERLGCEGFLGRRRCVLVVKPRVLPLLFAAVCAWQRERER